MKMDNSLLLKHRFQFITFGYVYHEEKIRNARQTNDDFHFIHVTKGKGELVIEDNSYQLVPGTVISVPRFTEFIISTEADFEMLNFHYQLWLPDGEWFDSQWLLPVSFKPDYFSYCRTILNRMDEVNRTAAEKLVLSVLAHELVIKHLEENSLIHLSQTKVDSRILKLKDFLTSKDCFHFDAGKAAKICGLSVSQMNRKFKYYYSLPPQKFWEKQLFIKISHIVKNTEKPFNLIAQEFKFRDHAYFTRWFRKMSGSSPSQFRNKQSVSI